MSDHRPYTLDRIVRLVFTIGIIAGLIWVVGYAADVLIPLAAGILLAYLLDPVVGAVQKLIKNRVVSVLITVTGFALFFLMVIAILVPLLSAEFTSSVTLVRELVQEGSPLRERLAAWFPEELALYVVSILEDGEVQKWLTENADLRAAALTVAKKVVPQVWGLVSGGFALLGFLVQLLLVLVYLIFVLIDFRKFEATWQSYIPPRARENVVGFLHDFNDAMSKYFRGQFVVAATIGVLMAIGFSVVGVKMAILLGLGIGMLNMVPYLQLAGTVPAYGLAVLTALETDESMAWYVIGVTLVFVVVQVIQDVLITPRVMGKVTGLRPVIILFAVFLWGKLLGFLGILLAIPLTCIGLAYYRRLLSTQQQELEAEAT